MNNRMIAFPEQIPEFLITRAPPGFRFRKPKTALE